MSEPIDKYTLLPDNRTTFERAYEEGTKGLSKSEDVLNWLNDPLKVRSDLLPIMASERGVNDWFFSDSEPEKRAITDSAYSVHQASGTNDGILRALKAVDFSAQISHWTEVEGGKPYSIYVQAWGDKSQGVTKERTLRLLERLNHVKSERDTVDLSVSFGVSASLAMTAHIPSSVNVTPIDGKASLWPQENCVASVAAAMGLGAPVSIKHIFVKAI